MAVVEALRLPLSDDLSGFIALLQQLRVPCRVSEEAGEQVLRVPAETVEQVRALYQRYPQGDGTVVVEQPTRRGAGFVAGLRRSPLTAVVLLLTLIVAAITVLGVGSASATFASTANTLILQPSSKRWPRASGGG
jgi:GlpG protein